MKFILASKSPRRIEILKKADFKFRVIPSKIDESIVSIDLKPEDYCMELAKLKSQDIAKKYMDYTVIGADTIVFIDGKILNKPLLIFVRVASESIKRLIFSLLTLNTSLAYSLKYFASKFA